MIDIGRNIVEWLQHDNYKLLHQARRKHFGSGAAIGTKKPAGGLGAEPWWGPRGRSPRKLREFGHVKALKLALLQQFRQDFYYKNLKAERHILKD